MQAGNGFGEVYFLVTRPDFSGPVPNRIPPNKAVPVQSTPLSAVSKRSLSLHSTPEAALDIDDEIDDFDDMDDSAVKHRKSSLNNNISNFVLSLPPFETGSPLKVVLSPSLFKSIYDVWTSFVLPAYFIWWQVFWGANFKFQLWVTLFSIAVLYHIHSVVWLVKVRVSGTKVHG